MFCMICSFWKSWSTLSLTGIFSMQNDPDLPKVQVSTFLGEGVEGRLKFFLGLWTKTDLQFLLDGSYDDMMV